MEITYDEFRYACPASAMPDDAVFIAISNYIELAKKQVEEFMTQGVFERLDAAEPSDDDYMIMQTLRYDAVTFICTSAFYEAVPQLDLVLTPTGFGVVSNQNVAPASADRVEKLRTDLRRCYNARLDSILSGLRHVKAWHETDAPRWFFGTLFWHSSQIRPIAGALATRDDLVSKHAEIVNAELKLANLISPEQLAEFRSLESKAEASPIQSMAIQFCRNYIIAIISGDSRSSELHSRTLLGFIESSPEEFPQYHASQTYKANHFEPYRNEKDDTCFFFG